MSIEHKISSEELNTFLESGLIHHPTEQLDEFKQRELILRLLEKEAKNSPLKKYIFDVVRQSKLAYSSLEQISAVKTISLNRNTHKDITSEIKKLAFKYLEIEDVIIPTKALLVNHLNNLGEVIFNDDTEKEQFSYPKLILIKNQDKTYDKEHIARLMRLSRLGDLSAHEDYRKFLASPKITDSKIDNLYSWLRVYVHNSNEDKMLHELLHSIYYMNNKVSLANTKLHTVVSETLSFNLSFNSIMLSTINDVNEIYKIFNEHFMKSITTRFTDLNKQFTKNILLKSPAYNYMADDKQMEHSQEELENLPFNGKQSYKSFVVQTVKRFTEISEDEEFHPASTLYRCLKEDMTVRN
jgi:hypothetical protein